MIAERKNLILVLLIFIGVFFIYQSNKKSNSVSISCDVDINNLNVISIKVEDAKFVEFKSIKYVINDDLLEFNDVEELNKLNAMVDDIGYNETFNRLVDGEIYGDCRSYGAF